MAAMERWGVAKLRLKREGTELELERAIGTSSSSPAHGEDFSEDLPKLIKHTSQVPAPLLPAADPLIPPRPVEPEGVFISSPMVGTFYVSAAPQEPAFVKVGDEVQKGGVICIIEAMKVMNEIKASHSGVIAEILVQNGHPVEFGTKLFRLKI